MATNSSDKHLSGVYCISICCRLGPNSVVFLNTLLKVKSNKADPCPATSPLFKCCLCWEASRFYKCSFKGHHNCSLFFFRNQNLLGLCTYSLSMERMSLNCRPSHGFLRSSQNLLYSVIVTASILFTGPIFIIYAYHC